MRTDFLQFSNFRKRFDGRTGLHENSLKKHPSRETAFFKFFVLPWQLRLLLSARSLRYNLYEVNFDVIPCMCDFFTIASTYSP